MRWSLVTKVARDQTAIMQMSLIVFLLFRPPPVPDLPPPKSLDNLFPPITDRPIFLLHMLELGEHFDAIAVDLFENDFENAAEHFEQFKEEYSETPELVPEWRPFHPMHPVQALESALRSGNQATVMEAYANVGQVCHNCHIVNMPKVQQKYHWRTFDGKTFSEIVIQGLEWPRLMQRLSGTLTGIGVDLEENQIDNAKMQFQNFNQTFQMLKGGCGNCHNTERRYFVDAGVQAIVDSLGQALNESPIDPVKAGLLSQRIGMASCFRCHLVHVPAAFAQMRER